MAVWVFPGQGSQRPDMTAGLDAAPALLREALDLIGAGHRPDDAGHLEDPEDPEFVQPALFVVGVAAATALLRHEPPPAAVIGHSFGEFAALTAAGALPFETGLRLAVLRARAMARLADARTGMAAVLGLTPDQVRAVCADITAATGDGDFVQVSNINSPSQAVVAGTTAALAAAADLCRERGAFRVRPIRVPYAAHTPLMAPAAAELRAALGNADIRVPAAKLYSCLTGEATADPDRIRELLVRGMTRPVDFHAAVRAAAHDGHRTFVELGPGSPARLLGLIAETLAAQVPPPRLRLVSSDAEAKTPQPFGAGRSRPRPNPTRQAVDDAR
ncbi:ACP S-malonyltransferase [Streptomyces sp. NPDC006645]|uniref:ACP S-malonyltransferase n=1 Tax=unclassified Streptomyces TaxID=2593676 RepID=UPI0033B043FE